MIKKLLSLAFLMIAATLFPQGFSGMYPFTGVLTGSASTGTIDPTPPPTANGLTFGAFSAVGFTSAPQAGGAFTFKEWGSGATNGDNTNFTGSVDLNKYYEVTLTPAPNATVCFNSVTFFMSRSSTGPRHWCVRSSLDSYSVNLPASISPSNPNIAVQNGNQFFWALDSYTVPSGKEEKGCTLNLGPNFADQTNPVTFRFYAYDAESNAGTFRIDTVTFNGLNVTLAGLTKLTYNLNSHFTLYPNPTNNGMVYLKLNDPENGSISITNLLGEIIAEQENDPNQPLMELNLSHLPKGTYFVNYRSNGKMHSEKLIISH